jgi:uncharacterized protein GlcG (DUF336 family)
MSVLCSTRATDCRPVRPQVAQLKAVVAELRTVGQRTPEQMIDRRHPLAAIRDALMGNTWLPPHPA